MSSLTPLQRTPQPLPPPPVRMGKAFTGHVHPMHNGHVRFGNETPPPTNNTQPANGGPQPAKEEAPQQAAPAKDTVSITPQTEDPATSKTPDGLPQETTPETPPQKPPSAKEAPRTFLQKTKDVFTFLINIPARFRELRDFAKSDNATLMQGLFFKQILPIMLSLGALIPVYGLVIGIAGIPLSILSGRYGSNLLQKLKTKENANLSDAMANIARIDEILGNPGKANSSTEIIDRINKAIDDALDVKKLPFLSKFIQRIRPTQHNALGRLFNNWNKFAFLANININVAKEDSLGKAAYSGIKGGCGYLLLHVVMPKVGMALEKGSRFMPFPLNWICKGLGLLMEYAGLLRAATSIGAVATSVSGTPGKAAA